MSSFQGKQDYCGKRAQSAQGQDDGAKYQVGCGH